jgi:hypothetical protein
MSIKLTIKKVGKVGLKTSVPPRAGEADPIEAVVVNTNVPADELARKVVTTSDSTIEVPAVDVVLKNSLNETLKTETKPAGINSEIVADNISLTIADQDAEVYDSKTIVVKNQTLVVNRPPVDVIINNIVWETVKSGDADVEIEVRPATTSRLIGAKDGQFWRVANSVVNVRRSDGTLIEAKSVAAEDEADSTVGDSTFLIKDSGGATLHTKAVKAASTDEQVVSDSVLTLNGDAFLNVKAQATQDIQLLNAADDTPLVPDSVVGNVIKVAAGAGGNEYRHEWDEPYSYCGLAPSGTIESSPTWTITRIEVFADGTTDVKTAIGAWTNKTSLIYT